MQFNWKLLKFSDRCNHGCSQEGLDSLQKILSHALLPDPPEYAPGCNK